MFSMIKSPWPLLLILVLIPMVCVGEGEPGAGWWSFETVRTVEVPSVGSGANPANPIDAFIRERLAKEGIPPAGPASPAILARRLHFDLLGLPPAPGVVDEFVRDPSAAAYRELIDSLLASPHYGERWARHWLDVARYGESNGFEYNEARRNAWPYRDWVIKALNDDLPYDEFARMQLAGDVLKPGREGAAAVGFLVAGTHNTVLGSSDRMKRQARQDELEELVGTVTQGFLGLTVHCARCHDHKTDPISNREYYRVAAALSGVHHGAQHGMFSVRSVNPGAMRIHRRGSAGDLGAEVAPGGVAALQGVNAEFKLAIKSGDAERRRAFAAWVTSPDNPLFARVIVNRVWHYHFGRGIVETPSDLGAGGGRPTHPDLLDWLAGWFRKNGYRLKALHRLILTSATWRQSSASRPEALAIDSANSLLWRFAPRRIEAEVLRDSILQVAGVLNTRRGGPGYEDVREQHFNAGRYYHPIEVAGEKFNRRTIYRFSPRGARDALLDTFDCPDPSSTSPRRAVTTTPLQALSLSNNRFVWRMAETFAGRLRKEAGAEVDSRVVLAWRLSLGRSPGEGESSRARRLVEKNGLESLCRVLFNASEFTLIE
jgi:hypothetical protein